MVSTIAGQIAQTAQQIESLQAALARLKLIPATDEFPLGTVIRYRQYQGRGGWEYMYKLTTHWRLRTSTSTFDWAFVAHVLKDHEEIEVATGWGPLIPKPDPEPPITLDKTNTSFTLIEKETGNTWTRLAGSDEWVLQRG